MFLVGSAACVVESIGPLNITTLGRRGPDLGTVRAARLARPSRRRRLEPPSPTATVQQVPRPIPPLPEHRSALQRTLGVSTSSSPRSLTLWFCASVPASCKPIRGESSIWRSARRCRFFPPSEISIDRGANQRNTHPVDAASPLWSSSLTSTRWTSNRQRRNMNRHTFASNETGAMSDLTAELRDRRFRRTRVCQRRTDDRLGWPVGHGTHVRRLPVGECPSPGPETRHCPASILQCNVELRIPTRA